MRNPNGPSREEIDDMKDALEDLRRERLLGAAACSAAASTCAEIAKKIDSRARRATEQQHQDGTWGNDRHDAEIMRMAVRVLEREAQQNI